MRECLEIFRRAVERELRNKINGEVETIAVNDICRARINCDGYVWGYTIYDLSEKLHRGYEAEVAANEIIGAYKKWVLRKYFKDEKGSSI